MSIYPVDFKNDKFWRKELCPSIRKWIKRSKCKHCGKKMMKGRSLYAYHALPFGYGWGDWWCSEKCCFGKGGEG